MYQATSSMIPRLGPEAYYEPSSHEADVVRLRQSAWHLIGTTDQLAKSGDYIATQSLGIPILVRRFDDQILGFRNVCAHRHCQLVDEGAGSTNELKCRYHGWHYGADGRTRRIPGAKNFPKFDRETHRLETFQVDTLGQLVFIKLSDQVSPLRQWLGEFEEPLRLACDGVNWKVNLKTRLTYASNWKIPVEGSLESYHIDEVHAKTFGTDPGEEVSDHELSDKGTWFRTKSRGNSLAERAEEASIRWMTGDFNPQYRHLHLFPNLMASLTEAITLVYQIEPLSAQECEMNVIGFGRMPRGRDLPRRMWAWGMRHFSSRIAMKVLMEDAKIFPIVQSGKRNAIDCGIFGRCEERLDAFHQYWSAPMCQQ